MKLVLGIVIGLVYLGLTAAAYLRAAEGWRTGYPDLGFWWAVIGTFLLIAALGAVGGTWIHTRRREGR